MRRSSISIRPRSISPALFRHRQFPEPHGTVRSAHRAPRNPSGLHSGHGLSGNTFSGFGGMQNVGTSGQIQSQNYEEKPSFNANVTWVKGAHTFKFGAEIVPGASLHGSLFGSDAARRLTHMASQPQQRSRYSDHEFQRIQHGLRLRQFPAGRLQPRFTQTPAEFYRQGYQQWGLFAQDSWKVTSQSDRDVRRALGLCHAEQEQYGRLGQLDPTLPNANAGGASGAVQYASQLQLQLLQVRVSFRHWTADRRSVSADAQDRVSWRLGIHLPVRCSSPAGATIGTTGVYPLSGAQPLRQHVATPGAIVHADLARYESRTCIRSPAPLGSRCIGSLCSRSRTKTGRRASTNLASASQQEITPNFIVEAAYVGNRAVWLGRRVLWVP